MSVNVLLFSDSERPQWVSVTPCTPSFYVNFTLDAVVRVLHVRFKEDDCVMSQAELLLLYYELHLRLLQQD
jgi:hypothetical protein